MNIKRGTREHHEWTIYALYSGDEYLGTGTITELSEMFHLAKSTLRFYASPALRRRRKAKDYKMLIRIGNRRTGYEQY